MADSMEVDQDGGGGPQRAPTPVPAHGAPATHTQSGTTAGLMSLAAGPTSTGATQARTVTALSAGTDSEAGTDTTSASARKRGRGSRTTRRQDKGASSSGGAGTQEKTPRGRPPGKVQRTGKRGRPTRGRGNSSEGISDSGSDQDMEEEKATQAMPVAQGTLRARDQAVRSGLEDLAGMATQLPQAQPQPGSARRSRAVFIHRGQRYSDSESGGDGEEVIRRPRTYGFAEPNGIAVGFDWDQPDGLDQEINTNYFSDTKLLRCADIGPEDFQGDSRDLLRADAELTAKTRNRIRAHIAKETNGEVQLQPSKADIYAYIKPCPTLDSIAAKLSAMG